MEYLCPLVRPSVRPQEKSDHKTTSIVGPKSRGWGYLRPDQFLEHLTLIKMKVAFPHEEKWEKGL